MVHLGVLNRTAPRFFRSFVYVVDSVYLRDAKTAPVWSILSTCVAPPLHLFSPPPAGLPPPALPLTGASPPEPAQPPLPRLIWAYWHAGALPEVAQACMASWRRHAPEWEVRLLNAQSVRAWLDEGADFPPITWSRLPAHQSDMFGLALVRRYGGLYMDATMLLSRPLQWVEERLRSRDWFGYYGSLGTPEIFMYASRPFGYCVSAWWRKLYDAWERDPELASQDAYTRALSSTVGSTWKRTYFHPGRLARMLRQTDLTFREHFGAGALSTVAKGPYELTVQVMKATGASRKDQLLPTLTSHASPLPASVRAEPVHKIQGSARLREGAGFEAAPGSWWSQLVGE